MFEFLKRNTDFEERIIALEKRVAALEKKNKKLAALIGSTELKSETKSESKPEPKAEEKAEPKAERKSARKHPDNDANRYLRKEDKTSASYQKKVENFVKKVMQRTGWDHDFTKEKMLATIERTGCTPTEFYMYRFYELTDEQQDTYYIAKYQRPLQEKFGTDKKFVSLLCNKERTNNYFSDYVRRPWCVNTKVTFEQFCEIFKDAGRVMYKPTGGHGGYGVEAIYLTPETMKDVYDRLVTYPEGVVEAFIKQHPDMCKLSPTSVNSLRFVTFSSNTKPVTPDGKMMDIAYSIVRIGREGSIVDNLHSGGMVANVDLETGCLATDGADRNGDLWVTHPDTGVTIKGFQVPYFHEACEMVKDAIATRKVEGYLGWDIAISENGPMLLEINARPGSDGLQTAPAQAKQGMKHLMEKYM